MQTVTNNTHNRPIDTEKNKELSCC